MRGGAKRISAEIALSIRRRIRYNGCDMAIIINTMEDFIRALDENPSWRDAVRERVLTRELLEFPERFAEYSRENNARMDALEMEFRLVREELAIVKAHIAALERRMGRFERDMGRLRAWHAAVIARDQSDIIAEDLGCEKIRTLSIGDLIRMARAADTSGILANDLRSFRLADLIMEAIRMETGETCYIAVEISFTVNGRDTSRAMRNAGFLRDFTGKDAFAVVAGVRKDDRVDADIAANRVMWYELDDEDMETE